MLKKLVFSIAFVAAAVSGFAQGSVNFNTQTLGTSARVYQPGATADGSTNNAAGGTAYFAQLFTADGFNASESSLTPKGNVVNLRTGVNLGYVQTTGTYAAGNRIGQTVDPVVQVTSVANGPVTLQLRVWSSSVGTSYAETAQYGKSGLYNVSTGGSGTTFVPDLNGLQGFVLQVPEPSTIALGFIGAGALLAIRRRK